MTDKDKHLLAEFDYGIISRDTFLKNFSIDIRSNVDFVRRELKAAIGTDNADEIQLTIALVWLAGTPSQFVDELNELLINPNHSSHQQIAKALQEVASPTTVPFVKKALESNFDYLAYPCSHSGVIAKWFSWLLYSIGTEEAIDLMKTYAQSADEGIRNEMLYRLKKGRS